jgi:hypothetical protein
VGSVEWGEPLEIFLPRFTSSSCVFVTRMTGPYKVSLNYISSCCDVWDGTRALSCVLLCLQKTNLKV